MHVDPEITINHISLKDYYCLQLYNALTPGHPNSLPLPEELPDATYQFTCEFGGLFKTLLLLPDIIWPYYTQQQKDEMALTISKWAHHRTTQNNWRIFNIVTLSFLKQHGYAIDDDLLKSHLLWVASYHAGNGWYLEQTYNYYTISLFIVYGTIWNRAFGDEYYPDIAAAIEKSAQELMATYSRFFARDGYVNMWARSICYRTWISGGFPIAFMLKDKTLLDPGWARRLCSGSILQFVTREEFYENDIPSLGFYGHKEFVLQNYSCPASPFIMFLPFVCLALPDDSPFWTAKENEGIWEKLGDGSDQVVLDKPGLVLVNHGKTGTARSFPAKSIMLIKTIPSWRSIRIFPGKITILMGGRPWNTVFAVWIPETYGALISISISPDLPCKMMLAKIQNLPHRKVCFTTGCITTFCTGRRSCGSRRTMALATSSIWPKLPSPAVSSAWIARVWPSNMN
jgi:hypothetical protein